LNKRPEDGDLYDNTQILIKTTIVLLFLIIIHHERLLSEFVLDPRRWNTQGVYRLNLNLPVGNRKGLGLVLPSLLALLLGAKSSTSDAGVKLGDVPSPSLPPLDFLLIEPSRACGEAFLINAFDKFDNLLVLCVRSRFGDDNLRFVLCRLCRFRMFRRWG